jgi:hypothetical protein
MNEFTQKFPVFQLENKGKVLGLGMGVGLGVEVKRNTLLIQMTCVKKCSRKKYFLRAQR